MADCKELDAALARLSAKIDSFAQQVSAINNKVDGLGSQLNNLEGRVSNLENKGLGNQQNNQPDLTPIYRRLSKLETYCQSVESFFINLKPIIKIIVGIFV